MAAAAQGWASQAALASLLKYQPQREGLADLQRAAEEQFKGSVRAGESEGILGMQAARSAAPQVKGIYDKAQTEGARGRSLLSPLLAALAPDSPFRLAAGNEQAAGGERLAGDRAHAESDVAQRGVAASELPAYSRQAALSTLSRALEGINNKRSSLDASQGANTAAELDKLQQAAQKAAAEERRSERTANTSREDSRETRAASRADTEANNRTSRENNRETNATNRAKGGGAHYTAPGVKEQSTAGHNKANDALRSMEDWIGKHGAGHSRAELVAWLHEGAPEQTIKEGGESFKTKARPGFDPNGVMAAALDQHEQGYLSKQTEDRLKREGYDPGRFGVPRYSERGKVESGRLRGLGKVLGKVGH